MHQFMRQQGRLTSIKELNQRMRSLNSTGVMLYRGRHLGFASGLNQERRWEWVTVAGETDASIYDATR